MFGAEAGWGLTFTNWNNNPLFVIADGRNHLLRSIDPVTYRVATLAGGRGLAPPGYNWAANMFPVGQCGLADGIGTNALFSYPIAASGADRNGAVYVHDFYNRRIRRMDLTTLNVTTVAGGGPGGMSCSSDGLGTNAAFDSLGFQNWVDVGSHMLYFRDYHNLVSLNLSDYRVRTLAGGGGSTGAGGLGSPCRVGWASAFGKDLFANGIGTAALLDQPRAIVVVPSDPDTVYFTTNSVIATYTVSTGQVSIWAGGGDKSSAGWPISGNNFDPAVGTSNLFANGVCIGLDTVKYNLIVGCLGSNGGGVGLIGLNTKKFHLMVGGGATPASIVRDGFGSYPTFIGTGGVSFWDMGSGGGMYYAFDALYGLLRQIQSSEFGPTNTPTPSVTPSQSPSPSRTPTNSPTTSPSPTYGSKTVTTLVGGNGDPSNRNTNFGFLDGVGLAASFSSPATDPVSAGIRGITYVSVGGSPTLFVADTFNSLIRRVDIATRNVTTIAGQPYTVSRGSNPRCTALKYVDATGTNAKFCHPFQIKESGGLLYVTDYWNDAIRTIDIATGAVSTLVGGTYGSGCNIEGIGTNAKLMVS